LDRGGGDGGGDVALAKVAATSALKLGGKKGTIKLLGAWFTSRYFD